MNLPRLKAGASDCWNSIRCLRNQFRLTIILFPNSSKLLLKFLQRLKFPVFLRYEKISLHQSKLWCYIFLIINFLVIEISDNHVTNEIVSVNWKSFTLAQKTSESKFYSQQLHTLFQRASTPKSWQITLYTKIYEIPSF